MYRNTTDCLLQCNAHLWVVYYKSPFFYYVGKSPAIHRPTINLHYLLGTDGLKFANNYEKVSIRGC
jgi:hypothetical protein